MMFWRSKTEGILMDLLLCFLIYLIVFFSRFTKLLAKFGIGSYDEWESGKKPLVGIAVIDPFCWPVRASMQKWILGLIRGDLKGQYDKWYFFSDTPKRRRAYDRYIRGIDGGVNAFLKKQDCFPVLLGMEQLDEKACNAVRNRLDVLFKRVLSGHHDRHTKKAFHVGYIQVSRCSFKC